MQRHLAAIMALDLAGFTRLVGADEDGTVTELKRLRAEAIDSTIEEHQGRVFKTTGDGVLAEFGSVVEAVRCAVGIQVRARKATQDVESRRRMMFRIGVHVGDVLVDGEDLLGDGVNIAARLEQAAAPGGVAMSSAVYEQVRDRLSDLAFRDGGEQVLKNVARPLRIWHVAVDEDVSTRTDPARTPGPHTAGDRPSLAILPFENMSGDPAQDYFAAGITEELVVAASRFRALLVIAETASATFRGQITDPRTIGSRLGARYLLQGTVRRAGDRVRVTAQLVDSSTAERSWADRYDAMLSDVFAVQDEITGRIIAAVAPHIGDAEIASARLPDREFSRSYDLALRAQALATDAREREDLEGVRAAVALAQKATLLQPVSPRAFEVLAHSWMRFVEISNFSDDASSALREAQDAAERARAMSPLSHTSHALLGHVAILSHRGDDALRLLSRALELNPNDPSVWMLLSWAESNDGRTDAALRHANEALQRTPMGSSRGRALWYLALAHWVAGDLAASVARGKEAITEKPGVAGYRGVVIASLVELGELDAARRLFVEVETISPDYVRSRLAGKSWFMRPEIAERYAAALRRAASR
jgi:adenylate cyclase